DRLAQLSGIDTDFAGKIVQRLRSTDVAAVDKFRGITVSRIDDAKAIFFKKRCITHQPGRNGGRRLVAFEHRQHKIMIGRGLVAKAMTCRIHRNEPWLGAVEYQMREQPFASVGPRNNRDRRPKAAGTLSWRSRGSQTLTDLDTVPDIVLAAHRVN